MLNKVVVVVVRSQRIIGRRSAFTTSSPGLSGVEIIYGGAPCRHFECREVKFIGKGSKNLRKSTMDQRFPLLWPRSN